MKRRQWLAILAIVLGCNTGQLWAAGAPPFYTNLVGMEFVLIPAGEFIMGSDTRLDHAASVDETPRHQVAISRAFYLGKNEVTQAQWQAVMGHNPSAFPMPDKPVEKVSWNDVQLFIHKLHQKELEQERERERLARERTRGQVQTPIQPPIQINHYRLPTEAEWEYAARAGSNTVHHWGDSPDRMAQYVWYVLNSAHMTQPVGRLMPNSWGLHDMLGNIREWVQDWYVGNYYAISPPTDPPGPHSGTARGVRGGSWDYNPARVRTASRNFFPPDSRFDYLGFRLVREQP